MPVFALIMKILGCAIGLYFAAAFVVSFTSILPFLTLASSIATIVSISRVEGFSDVWLPIVLTLMTMLFHRGEGYMNPNIVENAFRVIGVERKWESLFADDDEYIIHLAPVEIGGFFENTVLGAIGFFFFFDIFLLNGGSSWIAYIPAFYFLGMSVVEIVMVLGHRFGLFSSFPTLVYWIGRIAVIAAALYLGFTGPYDFFSGLSSEGAPSGKSAKELKAIYEQCDKYVSQSLLERSYSLDTGDGSIGGDYAVSHFIYDADIDAGAYYNDTEDGRFFYKIFATDPRLGAPACFVKDESTGAVSLSTFVLKADGYPYPFEPDSYTPYTQYDIPSLCEFTLDKVKNAAEVEEDRENKLLSIVYDSRKDTSIEHTVAHKVTYCFNVSDEGEPWALNRISCKIFDDAHEFYFDYAPLDTRPLDPLFVFGEEYLENYTPQGEMNGFYTQVEQAALQAFLEAKNNLGQYDFFINADIKGRYDKNSRDVSYYYDAEGEICAEYLEEEFGLSTNHDFLYWQPDRFISNRYSTIYDASFTPIESDQPFLPFTGDEPVTSQNLLSLFDTEVDFWKHDVSAGGDRASVRFDGIFVLPELFVSFYDVQLRRTETDFVAESIQISFSYSERDEHGALVQDWTYVMFLYFEDEIDIPAPFH